MFFFFFFFFRSVVVDYVVDVVIVMVYVVVAVVGLYAVYVCVFAGGERYVGVAVAVYVYVDDGVVGIAFAVGCVAIRCVVIV